jgi:hypothetical protein
MDLHMLSKVTAIVQNELKLQSNIGVISVKQLPKIRLYLHQKNETSKNIVLKREQNCL